MTNLETQLYAARGFAAYLSAQPTNDLHTSLLHVLETYQLELQRQINGSPTEQDWLGILALASLQAQFLRDELTDATPELMEYRPADEPRDIEQMKIRLLADAVTLFDATVDGRVYLDIPDVAIEIENFVNKVTGAFSQQ